MICRIWNGYPTPENATAYETIVRTEVIPGIEARPIPGFIHIDLLRHTHPNEVEFTTLMWFTSPQRRQNLHGRALHQKPRPPPAAQAVLTRLTPHAAHHEVLDHRPQTLKPPHHGEINGTAGK